MTVIDTTDAAQTDSISFEFDLHHSPAKVWRALTEPALLAQWLLPVLEDLKLDPGAAFTFKTQPYPGWDGTVNCKLIEIEPQRKLSYTWTVPFLDTVVTFTLTPTPAGTRLSLVQSGFKPDQKQNFGGARYGWNMMGGKLVDLLAGLPEPVAAGGPGSA
ncbi:MAG TPA: SRPBCC domain-containing protein [Polyangiaceae bacterium]|nr:SRPBCC domain-containing protein [Polyangiaceae bacterium]